MYLVNINLKGMFYILVILSIFGLWKVIEIALWLIQNVTIK